ncbi:MAG: hypothetical protein H6735_14765 [Alphaproteobacteria bacterium]|nr:hypothetical protein [Alphaproteobacteria bacterium]
MSRRAWAIAAVGLLLAAALGVLPWLGVVGQLPWAADSLVWVARGTPDDPGWWDWVMHTRHFVGWRPVTAISFVVDGWLAGARDPRIHLVTNLVLHALGGALVWLAWRRWTGDRGAWGLIAVLVVLGHPVADDVVTVVARRSYLLSLDLGLVALIAHRAALERPLWSLASGLALMLAALAHEQAAVLLPVLALSALATVPWRAALTACAAPTVLLGVALAGRARVLGGWLGGYDERWFASLGPDGRPIAERLESVDPWAIGSSAIRYLLDPHGPSGLGPLLPSPLAWGVAVALVVAAAWALREGRRRPAVWVAWILGGVLLVVLSGTWFWRQAHAVLVPLGFLLAELARDAAARWSTLRARSAAELGLVAMVLAAVASPGALVRGTDREAQAARQATEEVSRLVRYRAAQVEGPGTLWLAVPVVPEHVEAVVHWCSWGLAPEGLECRVMAHLAEGATAADADLRVDGSGTRNARLVLEDGMVWRLPAKEARMDLSDGLPLAELWEAGKVKTWFVGWDDEEWWTFRIRH